MGIKTDVMGDAVEVDILDILLLGDDAFGKAFGSKIFNGDGL